MVPACLPCLRNGERAASDRQGAGARCDRVIRCDRIADGAGAVRMRATGDRDPECVAGCRPVATGCRCHLHLAAAAFVAKGFAFRRDRDGTGRLSRLGHGERPLSDGATRVPQLSDTNFTAKSRNARFSPLIPRTSGRSGRPVRTFSQRWEFFRPFTRARVRALLLLPGRSGCEPLRRRR